MTGTKQSTEHIAKRTAATKAYYEKRRASLQETEKQK